MADKDGMERKVYLLPTELVARIKDYQTKQGIVSEVEAARRLLDTALQMRDGAEDILNTLDARFALDRDLRALARDVLASHALVTEIHVMDNLLRFTLRNGQMGSISPTGSLGIGRADGSDYLNEYIPPSKRRVSASSVQSKAAPKAAWDSGAAKASDLDEEIPF